MKRLNHLVSHTNLPDSDSDVCRPDPSDMSAFCEYVCLLVSVTICHSTLIAC